MFDIINYIIDLLYTPLLSALNELPFLAQVNNGVSLSVLISTIVSVVVFFLIFGFPIFLIINVIKRLLK